MYLGNPLLPIKIASADAAEKVKKELKKKNWYDFELAPLKLTLVPYFLFNYHYYIETDNEGLNTIKSMVNGILAIDGHEVRVRPDMVDVLKYNWKHTEQEVPRGEFIEKYCNIDKNEQTEVIKLKTAQHFNVPKQNVVVSDSRKLLIPFYKTSVSLQGRTYSLTINAINATIEGIKDVPERQKSYSEITKETLNELKDPKNWVVYSIDAVREGFSVIASKGGGSSDKVGGGAQKFKTKAPKVDLSIFESRGVLILIILLAILLILASIFKIKFV